MVLTYYEPFYWRSPANNLVRSVQEFCKEVVINPAIYGVEDFYALEDRVHEHINEIRGNHPRCKPSDLKIEVRKWGKATESMEHYKAKVLAAGLKLEGLYEWSFTISHRKDNMSSTVYINAIY